MQHEGVLARIAANGGEGGRGRIGGGVTADGGNRHFVFGNGGKTRQAERGLVRLNSRPLGIGGSLVSHSPSGLVGAGCPSQDGGVVGDVVSREVRDRQTGGIRRGGNGDVIDSTGVPSALLEPTEGDSGACGEFTLELGEVHAVVVVRGGDGGDGCHDSVAVDRVVDIGHITHRKNTLGSAFHSAPEGDGHRVERMLKRRQDSEGIAAGRVGVETKTLAALCIVEG